MYMYIYIYIYKCDRKFLCPLNAYLQENQYALKPNYLMQVSTSACPTPKNHIPSHQPISVIVPSWKAPPFFLSKITLRKMKFF